MEILPGCHDDFDFQQTDAETHEESEDAKSPLPSDEKVKKKDSNDTFEKFKQGDKVSVWCLNPVGFPREYPAYIGSDKQFGETLLYCVHYADGDIGTHEASEFQK